MLHRQRGGSRRTPAARRTGGRRRPGRRSGRSLQDRVDDGLPCRSELAWQDEVGPRVDEERSIDETEQISRRAFAQHDLVAAGASASVGEIEHGAGCRPVQTERQRHLGESFLERESPEPIGDERWSSVSKGDIGEGDPRLGLQLEAGGGEEASRGCVVRSDVIRPISVLNRSVSTSRPRLEFAQRLVSGPFWTDSPWSTRVLDGGAIIPSTPCISPGRWHFSWGSSESTSGLVSKAGRRFGCGRSHRPARAVFTQAGSHRCGSYAHLTVMLVRLLVRPHRGTRCRASLRQARCMEPVPTMLW